MKKPQQLMDNDVAKIHAKLAQITTVLETIKEDQKEERNQRRLMKGEIAELQKFQHSSSGMGRAVTILLGVLSGVLGVALAIRELT